MDAETAPTRLRADSRPVVLTATALIGVLAVAAFLVGVPGLLLVAEWIGLPRALRPLVPIIFDVGLVIYALAAVVRRARGESARFALSALACLTALSVLAQVAHVLVPAVTVTGEVIGGAVAAAVAPLMVFASTHTLLDLAIAPAPQRRRARRKSSVPAPTPTRAPVAKPSAGPTRTGDTKNPTPAPKTAPAPAGDRDAQRAEVLRLREQGLSYARVAAEVGVPASTAKRWAAAS